MNRIVVFFLAFALGFDFPLDMKSSTLTSPSSSTSNTNLISKKLAILLAV